MGSLELLAWGAVALWAHMGGWEFLAWGVVALVTVFRVALLVGTIALVVAIVRGVLATQPVPHTN